MPILHTVTQRHSRVSKFHVNIWSFSLIATTSSNLTTLGHCWYYIVSTVPITCKSKTECQDAKMDKLSDKFL